MREKQSVLRQADDIVLSVQDLHTSFVLPTRKVYAVRGVDFDLYKGETLAIVGESGCGKSATCLSILRLIPADIARIEKGEIWFENLDLAALPQSALRSIRGQRIAMIYQDPMTAFNVSMTIGDQIIEAIREHKDISKKDAYHRALDLLKRVGIPAAENRMRSYPHEFSGGMRQRAIVAMALACDPDILIADEPTTALDVTTQAQILELLKDLQEELGLSIILVTHDLGIVASIADRILIMYAGRVAEVGPLNDIFYRPRHPYTQALLRSIVHQGLIRKEALDTIPGAPPSLTTPLVGCVFASRCQYVKDHCAEVDPSMELVSTNHKVACFVKPTDFEREHIFSEISETDNGVSRGPRNRTEYLEQAFETTDAPTLLDVKNVYCSFPVRRFGGGITGTVRALNGVTFQISRGQTLGLVGESGCGKSTLARVVLRLIEADQGTVELEGTAITDLSPKSLRMIRQHIQIVFQDPFSSLNPKLSIRRILSEPLLNYGTHPTSDQLIELLEMVGLGQEVLERRPGQLSGGQQQRVVIARALALRPKLLVCDEPTSALDASVRAQILNLLVDLQHHLDISYLFISHDLEVVSFMSDRVAVMYLGFIVEMAPSTALYSTPKHPYTKALLSALPLPDPKVEQNRTRLLIDGDPPDPIDIPSGCPFHTRCPIAEFPICATEMPTLSNKDASHYVACHLVDS